MHMLLLHMLGYLQALDAGDGIEGEVQAGEAGEAGQPLHAAQLVEADHKRLQPYCTLQPLKKKKNRITDIYY